MIAKLFLLLICLSLYFITDGLGRDLEAKREAYFAKTMLEFEMGDFEFWVSIHGILTGAYWVSFFLCFISFFFL